MYGHVCVCVCVWERVHGPMELVAAVGIARFTEGLFRCWSSLLSVPSSQLITRGLCRGRLHSPTSRTCWIRTSSPTHSTTRAKTAVWMACDLIQPHIHTFPQTFCSDHNPICIRTNTYTPTKKPTMQKRVSHMLGCGCSCC